MALFAADVLWVAVVALTLMGCLRLSRDRLLEATISWLLLTIVVVVLSGVLLSAIGVLGRTGFCVMHGIALVVLLTTCRRKVEVLSNVRKFGSDWWRLLRRGTFNSWLCWAFIFVLGFLALLTARADVVVYDALTYRLARIGQWLQDGYIYHFKTDDPRLNYMPIAPDVVIAWLLSATTAGFKGAALSQLWGGVLLLAATFGLARTVGLSHGAAWGAVAIVLGMGNVAAQFTAVQSDLFTAGIVAASYLLWHRATARGERSLLGGIGLGLAWGSKGTMFYLAPGALLWLAWLTWRYRSYWRQSLAAGCFAGLSGLVFAVPVYLRNVQSYHSLFGPPEAVQLHHGGPFTVSERVEKLCLNLRTSAIQLCDPNAQPLWLQESSQRMGLFFAQRDLNEDDPFLFLHNASRRTLLGFIMGETEPDADVVSCGLIASLLFGGGIVVALIYLRSDAAAKQIVVWSVGVVVYLVVQNALVQWHQWAFRFVVLAAPWIAVVGAWGVSRIPKGVRLAIWTVVVASQLQVFFTVQWQTNQDAWQSVTRPDRALGHFIYSHWRDWADTLDHVDEPLRLAFPINHIISAFYRLSPPRSVSLEKLSELQGGTAEAAVGNFDGWLLLPINQFKGREGRVLARTWLFNGESHELYGVAAFRRLGPTESPVPVVYRSNRNFRSDGLDEKMTVKAWSSPLKFRLKNNASEHWQFVVHTAYGVRSGVVPAGAAIMLELPVSTTALNDLLFQFNGQPSGGSGRMFPSVEILP